MNEKVIREPRQKRSIEKKEKIIKQGFKLICEKGYYNTNTAEIAKAAEVSTGIVYQYFNDKHDIFIEGLKRYADSIFYPILNISAEEIKEKEFDIVIKSIIDSYIKNHNLSQIAHEEIMSMVHSDKEVAYFFHKQEMEMTIQITNVLQKNNFNSTNLMEKVHISIGIIDNLCHEIIYHKHSELNYNEMIDIVVETIVNLLKSK